MKVNRADLLQAIEGVKPGLAPGIGVDQSDCLAFSQGRIWTYNEEVLCSTATNLDLECAVPAAPFTELLTKMQEPEVEISAPNGELKIEGKRRRAGLQIQQPITLPITSIEKPTKWHKLPEGFLEGIDLSQACALEKDREGNFDRVCIHLHPQWIEAHDGMQVLRYKVACPVSDSVLARQSAIKPVHGLNMTRFAETDGWLHFKNADGLTLSCRRYLEEFPDLTAFLNIGSLGKPLILPKSISAAVEKAQIFSMAADVNYVLVELMPDKLRVRGEGPIGWYSESRKVRYKGKSFSFLIPPKLLAEIAEKHNEVTITEDRMKAVDPDGKWEYATVLGRVQESD